MLGKTCQVLRELRKARDFSQEELAFRSGYHPTYIGQLERGKKSPSLRAIASLAKALSTTGSDLLRRLETLAPAEVHPRQHKNNRSQGGSSGEA